MESTDRDAVRIQLLGPLRVQIDGATIDVGGPKAKAVLVTLAHHVGEVVRLDTLFEALWNDQPPRSARNAIQVRVSDLRRALGPSLTIRSSSAGYVIESAGVSTDAAEFEELVESAEVCLDDDPSTALDLVDAALAMWNGEPVAIELDIRPLQGRLAALSETRTRAWLTRLDARLRLGEHVGCCADAETLVDQHPFREDFRARHMLALYRSGRQSEALGAFRRTRSLLVDELGVEPGSQLQELHRRILEQDPGLEHDGASPGDSAVIDVVLPGDNLRAEPNALVERPEIDTVVDALDSGRVVTVLGTGGIGKSRCVSAAARRCLDSASFADGVWIVDLSPLPDGADDVALCAAAAMGLGQQPGTPVLDTIVGYLRERRTLLVLDNCEHVATAAADFADRVAAGCPGTAFLAASRVRLGLLVETIVTLERLTDDAARRLLDARIREAGAGPFADDDCSSLCAVLDNYPLAIELAAARTRSIGPREIATRLAEQPKLLGSRTDHHPDNGGRRHADLADALDWSLDRLSVRSRSTLDRATVFVSDFNLATAESVLATAECGADDVVEDLGELVEHHLVSRDHGRARFRLLEPIRQHLRAGAPAADRDRYIDHFATFAGEAARGLRGPDEAIWWDRWRAELSHVREAVRLAIDGSNLEVLESFMAELALTNVVCTLTEPGEWAVTALRQLQLAPTDAPGVAVAAAAQLSNLDLTDECDALLGPLLTIDDQWIRTIATYIGHCCHPSDEHWLELFTEYATASRDPAMMVFAAIRHRGLDAINDADQLGNPTLRVTARQWSSGRLLDKHSAAGRRNKEELYRIALTSNNERTIAEGQMFMAFQHCYDNEPRRAGPLCAEFIERIVRLRSPHQVFHSVEAIANMLAILRVEPYSSEVLWAAVSAAERTPYSRLLRDETLPIFVASQLTDDERRAANAYGSSLDMDMAAREARKAAERMSGA